MYRNRNRMRFFREQIGMTKQRIADKTGLSLGYICHLEIGSRKNPRMKVMKKLLIH